MPDFLPLLLIAVIVIVAIAIVVFLRRRRREAQEAAIIAAATPVPELSEDDIAWRIGVAGVDRPEGDAAAEGFAAAEAAAFNAAYSRDNETGAAGETPVAPPVAPVPVAAAVAGTTRPRATAAAPLPNRWRLWRDSAAVLLVVVLAVLAVSLANPWRAGPTTSDPLRAPSSPVTAVESHSTAPGVLEPAPEPTATLGPAVAFTPEPSVTSSLQPGSPSPGATPPATRDATPPPQPDATARPTARPTATPRPTLSPIVTPRPTARPTPTPTAPPTPDPTPQPTPPPTPEPPPADG